MTYLVLLFGLIISGCLSLVTIPLLIKIVHKYKILDMPGLHKRHKNPTPPLGGVSLLVTCWFTVGLILLFFPSQKTIATNSIIYIFLGHLVIFLVGLSDDLSPLAAWIKLLAQIACGFILFLAGLEVNLMTTPFGAVEIGFLSPIITILWVIILTNAINLIDGLDGLAGGVSLIGAITLIIIGQFYQSTLGLFFILSLIGFLIPFLYFNKYPAKIFLGDSGAMQIGFIFAVFSLLMPLKSYTTAALYVPLLALGVPLTEIVLSFSRRLVSGKNILKADRRHLFHYLALSGLSHKKIIWIFYLLAIIYGLFAIAMFYWNRVLVLTILIVFMVVIFIGFFIFITKLSRLKSLNGRSWE
jgi:UDP-GlcNAc:undecaprenyl-phosphate GlcNAc-1-phosphate transferase